MWLLLFMPWAMIGAFGCVARNSFHTEGCVPGNSAFNTTVSGTSNSLNRRPTRALPQSIAYWRKASFTRSGLRVARSGRKTGPWPKPNSSTNRAKLTATFLPPGQAETWTGSRGKAVTQSAPSCAKARGGKASYEQRRWRAAEEQRDDLASFHSITSSACENKLSQIVRPSAFALSNF